MEYKILISLKNKKHSISIFIILRINIRILFDKQFIDETHRYSLIDNVS